MNLISESYRAQNAGLHSSSADYGTTSRLYVDQIREVVRRERVSSILDYGCGKGILRKKLGAIVSEYDPCIEWKDARPRPSDLVVCIDVLEHIEPECLTDVLTDLRALTLRLGFFTIGTSPAQKTLPDGRNAHLTVETAEWWLPRLFDAGFKLRKFARSDGSLLVVMT